MNIVNNYVVTMFYNVYYVLLCFYHVVGRHPCGQGRKPLLWRVEPQIYKQILALYNEQGKLYCRDIYHIAMDVAASHGLQVSYHHNPDAPNADARRGNAI